MEGATHSSVMLWCSCPHMVCASLVEGDAGALLSRRSHSCSSESAAPSATWPMNLRAVKGIEAVQEPVSGKEALCRYVA